MTPSVSISCEYFVLIVHSVHLVNSRGAGADRMKAQNAYTRTIELRKKNRYRLSAPAFFFWAPQNGPPRSGEGMTRDVNATGVYIIADETPPVGALVQMDIVFPNMAGGEPGPRLTGEGVVLRVDPRSNRMADASNCGFAASVQFYPEPSESVLSQLKGSRREMCGGRGSQDAQL
jgi:hypothetical protein